MWQQFLPLKNLQEESKKVCDTNKVSKWEGVEVYGQLASYGDDNLDKNLDYLPKSRSDECGTTEIWRREGYPGLMGKTQVLLVRRANNPLSTYFSPKIKFTVGLCNPNPPIRPVQIPCLGVSLA